MEKGIDAMPDSMITKKALAQALKELMLEEPISKISVGDVCSRCGMNRKSFYYHFKDKYDLVNWIYYTEFFDNFLLEHVQGWEFIEQMCEYFAQNIKFYQNALEIHGQNSFYEYFGEVLSSLITENLDPLFSEGAYHDFYITLFVDAFRSVIIHWIKDGAIIAPKTFTQLLKNAAMGFGYRVLMDSENTSQDM